MKRERKDYMTEADKRAMGDLPRTHANCVAKTGKARPGKTAKDKVKGGARECERRVARGW